MCVLKLRVITSCLPSGGKPPFLEEGLGVQEDPLFPVVWLPAPYPRGISGPRKKPQWCSDHGECLQATLTRPPALGVAV